MDVNKGDYDNPNCRSRLVAREIRRQEEEAIFSPTSPLEALRSILNLVATSSLWSPSNGRDVEISVIDISRASFNARTKEDDPVYVELLPEDPDYGSGLCGRLNVHMYGTRKAADGWHCEYADSMEEIAFERGVSSACLFVHHQRSLICSVHGDDVTTAGPSDELDWFKKQLEARYI